MKKQEKKNTALSHSHKEPETQREIFSDFQIFKFSHKEPETQRARNKKKQPVVKHINFQIHKYFSKQFEREKLKKTKK